MPLVTPKPASFLSALLMFAVFVTTFANIFFLPPIPTSHAATTYYVAKTGSDSNPCTQTAPCLTIGKGVSMLTAGDTLYVRSGTYQGRISGIPSGTSWNAPVTIAAYPGETVTVRRFDIPRSYIVVDGFIVDTDPALGVVGIQLSGAHHIRIMNTEVKNSPGQGILGGEHGEFINLNVHQNGIMPDGTITCTAGQAPAQRGYCHGIYVFGDGNMIDGGRYYDNEGHGIHFYNNSNPPRNSTIKNARVYNNWHGIGVYSQSNNNLYNNISYNNRLDNIRFSSSNSKIYNNTTYGSVQQCGIRISGSSNAARNNITYSNAEGGVCNTGSNNVLSHNLTTDPKFVNVAQGDFHLQSSSPAIDAGTTVSEVAHDFDCNKRPAGSAYDMGAFEYNGVNDPNCLGGSGTTTPAPTGPQPCSRYLSNTPAPSPYGLAWNWLSSGKELLLSLICEGSTAKITIGKTNTNIPASGTGLTYSWSKAYAYDGSSWNVDKPIPLTCNGTKINVPDASPSDALPDYWCNGTLTGSLPGNASFFAGFTCIRDATSWQCGCTDVACMQTFWQLQGKDR